MRRILLALLSAAVVLAQTAKFPTSVATDADLLHAYDRAAGTLAAPMDASTLTMTVTDGTPFAGAAYFAATIGDERVLVCSVSGATLTICADGRGWAGSTAGSHSAGAAVRANITAWHHNALAAEIKAIEGALGAGFAISTSGTANTVVKRDGAGQITTPQFNGALHGNADTVTNGVVTTGSYTDPTWLTITKSKVGLGSVDNTALSTWAGSANITTIGTLAAGSVPWARITNLPAKQLNFGCFDPSGGALAATVVDGVWRPENAGATMTQVACRANTGDEVVMLRNNGVNALSANLTCGNGTFATSTSFASATVATGNAVGFQIVSGSASQIMLSVKYTGN